MSMISTIGRVALVTVAGTAVARFTTRAARELCNHAQEINAEKMDALHRWQVRRRAARITREMQLNLEALAYLQGHNEDGEMHAWCNSWLRNGKEG